MWEGKKTYGSQGDFFPQSLKYIKIAFTSMGQLNYPTVFSLKLFKSYKFHEAGLNYPTETSLRFFKFKMSKQVQLILILLGNHMSLTLLPE